VTLRKRTVRCSNDGRCRVTIGEERGGPNLWLHAVSEHDIGAHDVTTVVLSPGRARKLHAALGELLKPARKGGR
jgi:hypothetical protein